MYQCSSPNGTTRKRTFHLFHIFNVILLPLSVLSLSLSLYACKIRVHIHTHTKHTTTNNNNTNNTNTDTNTNTNTNTNFLILIKCTAYTYAADSVNFDESGREDRQDTHEALQHAAQRPRNPKPLKLTPNRNPKP